MQNEKIIASKFSYDQRDKSSYQGQILRPPMRPENEKHVQFAPPSEHRDRHPARAWNPALKIVRPGSPASCRPLSEHPYENMSDPYRRNMEQIETANLDPRLGIGSDQQRNQGYSEQEYPEPTSRQFPTNTAYRKGKNGQNQNFNWMYAPYEESADNVRKLSARLIGHSDIP